MYSYTVLEISTGSPSNKGPRGDTQNLESPNLTYDIRLLK